MSIMIYTRDLMKGYFDDGYSITLTEAPNDIGESLRRGTVLTTRELPKTSLRNWTSLNTQSCAYHVDL